MSLPNQWIDRIFEKLGLVYGQEFLNRWKGLPIAEVKADWAHELAGFDNHPEAVSWALRNLPVDRPPSVLQFREMCRRAPSPDRIKLPEPRANPDRVRSELAKLRASYRGAGASASPTDWAHRILAEHRAGVLKTQTVLSMALSVTAKHPLASQRAHQRDPGSADDADDADC